MAERGDGGAFLIGSALFSVSSALLPKVPFGGVQHGNCGLDKENVRNPLTPFRLRGGLWGKTDEIFSSAALAKF